MADAVDAVVDTRSQAAEEVAHVDAGEVEAEAADRVDAAIEPQAAGEVEAAAESQAARMLIFIVSQSMVN